LLLTVILAVNAVSVQNDRYAWLDTGVPAASGTATSRDPLWTLITTDLFNGQGIYRADVAATGPASPVPPGIPRDPGPGQYYISPALAALLRSALADELANRYPGHQAGLIGRGGPAVPRLAGHHRRAFGWADVAPAWRRKADQLQHHSAERLRHS
jgi:hypothetical protein